MPHVLLCTAKSRGKTKPSQMYRTCKLVLLQRTVTVIGVEYGNIWHNIYFVTCLMLQSLFLSIVK